MQQIKLILILASCLVLKATIVAGAEMEKSGPENINTRMAMNEEVIANPDYALGDPYALDWKQIVLIANNDDTTQAATMSDATAAVAPAPAALASTSTIAPVQNNNVRVNVEGGDNRMSNEMNSTMNARMQDNSSSSYAAITPMIGMTNYYGAWGSHVRNTYSLGLGLEVALNSLIGLEIEGGYSRSNVGYSYYNHDFSNYNIGGNAKLYLSRRMIQPWIGFGAMGLYYENMSHGPAFPYSNYGQWVGAIQPLAGLDVEVVKGMAVGIRGAYVIPTVNKPNTLDNGRYSYSYFEEAGLINTSFYKVMADVKVMF